jgi:hypothetical protein
LKDETKRQVAEMLVKRLIQPSISEFSSAALLVKKKMGPKGSVWITGISML